ncbi:MAG: hypothetical protein DRQ41_15405 [Gammaproteobacteria bacterium]|nr:MAG: hypothetical protein DRQ41_15405 [Gammaproteobacteria bacterium]
MLTASLKNAIFASVVICQVNGKGRFMMLKACHYCRLMEMMIMSIEIKRSITTLRSIAECKRLKKVHKKWVKSLVPILVKKGLIR